MLEGILKLISRNKIAIESGIHAGYAMKSADFISNPNRKTLR
jgi:hypothetical protein